MPAHETVGPGEQEICRHSSQEIALWGVPHLPRNNQYVVGRKEREIFTLIPLLLNQLEASSAFVSFTFIVSVSIILQGCDIRSTVIASDTESHTSFS